MKNITIESVYPLTSMQQGIFFECKLNENTNAYFIQNIFRMTGEINTDYMKIALELLSVKYDVLRSRFMMSKKENKPVQFVLKEQTIEYEEYDLKNIPVENTIDEIKSIAAKDIDRGFDLIKDSLLRLKVLHTSCNECFLIFSTHHIIIDGWCCVIVIKEFIEFYNCLCNGDSRLKLLNKIKRQKERIAPFSDYVKWQSCQDKKNGLDYWKNYLYEYDESAVIPSLKIAEKHTEQMNEYKISIDSKTTSELVQIAKHNMVTLSNVSEMIWGIILMKYCRLNDVVFGKVVSGRNVNIKGIENAVGIYVNVVPERIKINKESTFLSVMKQIATDSYNSAEYEYCSFAEIQATSILKNKLIDSIFTFENFYAFDEDIFNSEHCKLTLLSYREETNYPISVKVNVGNTLNFDILYNPNVYSKTEMELIGERIDLIAKSISNNIYQTIWNMALADQAEKEKILRQFNSEIKKYNDKETINSVFEKVVSANEEKTAVVCEEKSLTYRELNQKSNCLANYIQIKGGRKNDIIAVFTERKIEVIIAFLAIQKMGGIYLPLDGNQPQHRINMILEDAKPSMILSLGDDIKFNGQKINICNELIYNETISNPENINNKDSYSYIIYTSGTTGKPKGVLLSHEGIVNLKYFFKNDLKIDCNDRIAQFANYVFDASIWEFTMALLNGGCLYILSKKTIDTPMLCSKYLKDNNISVVTFPPLYCKQLDLPKIRLIITAGAASDEALISLTKEKGCYINAYGPTEDTVCTTFYVYKSKENHLFKRVPIGIPILNHQVYIMQDNQLCPVGIPGELRIAGCGIAKEYLNNHELTSQKFIDNPFGDGKMYCSGDLARWLPDGNIDFMGRIDKQVKIRGFRIELEEISSVLMSFKEINEAVAVVKEKNKEKKYICVYFSSNEILDTNGIKKKLTEYLPNYMIPSKLIQINEIPVNTSGKPDIKKLLSINISCDQKIKRPENLTEEKIEKIYCKLLGEEAVDVESSFFELGGESISAMTLLSILEKEFSLQLSLNHFYKYSSVKDLARMLELKQNEKSNENLKVVLSENLMNEINGYKIIEYNAGYILLVDDVVNDKIRQKILKCISGKCSIPNYIFNKHLFENYSIQYNSDSIEKTIEIIISENRISQEMYYNLNLNIQQYRQKLLQPSEKNEYTLSLIQNTLSNLGIWFSCGLFSIEGKYELSEIEAAWKKVLEEQPLLRSIIQKNNGEDQIKELIISNEWHIPYLDITYYSMQDRHELIQRIKREAELYYNKDIYCDGEVNHVPILLKEENKYIFILPCSHLFFDGFSNTILKSSIIKFLDNPSLIPTFQRYQECIDQFRYKIDNKTSEIIKLFEIAKFKEAVDSFSEYLAKTKMNVINYTFQFSDEQIKNISSIRTKINDHLFMDILDIVFPNINVPVCVLQAGRNNDSSLKCIGAFLDIVPVVYEHSSGNKFIKDIHEYVNYLRKNEMNIIASADKIIPLELKEKMLYSSIIYNNLLIYEMEYYFDNEAVSYEYAKRIVNIIITNNKLCISLMCVLGKEKETKEAITNRIKNIINNN